MNPDIQKYIEQNVQDPQDLAVKLFKLSETEHFGAVVGLAHSIIQQWYAHAPKDESERIKHETAKECAYWMGHFLLQLQTEIAIGRSISTNPDTEGEPEDATNEGHNRRRT